MLWREKSLFESIDNHGFSGAIFEAYSVERKWYFVLSAEQRRSVVVDSILNGLSAFRMKNAPRA